MLCCMENENKKLVCCHKRNCGHVRVLFFYFLLNGFSNKKSLILDDRYRLFLAEKKYTVINSIDKRNTFGKSNP